MPEVVKRTHAEFIAELTKRFGDSPANWAFVCPSCGDVATGQDFRDALNDYEKRTGEKKIFGPTGDPMRASDVMGQICIGRILGALENRQEEWTGRGCDWAAFGLFRGPEFVIFPNGTEMAAFAIAPAP